MDRKQPSSPLAEIALPRDARCAARARETMRGRFSDHLFPDDLDTALLITSELVTNAWKHGEGTITLRVEQREDRLRIEVVDEGTGQTGRIRPQDGDASGGWGLQLVEDVAVNWGCFEGTTHVWAEIEVAEDAGQRPDRAVR